MRDHAQLLDLRARLGHEYGVTRRAGWSAGVLMLVAAWPGHAHAQDAAAESAVADEPVDLSEPPPPPPLPVQEESWLNAASERRCGFTLGVQLGPLVGAARGYPNDALKLDRDEFLTETGVGFGGQIGLYLGIAMADWFVFGLGPSFGRLSAGDYTTGFFSGTFHIDAFPAFGAGGAWRDLAVTLDAGLAILQTTDANDSETLLIDSSTGSRLAAGVVWEGVRAWKLSMGPYLAADLLWSPTAFRPAAWIGWRTTFYGGP